MPPHPLTNFEIWKYYQNEPRFNGVYSRDNLPKRIKGGTHAINLDEYLDVGTHWIALCKKYWKSFILTISEMNMFLKKSKNLLGIKAYIFGIQSNNSVMCG